MKKIEKNFRDFIQINPYHYASRSISQLIKKFHAYLSELPIVGFNSQKYDLNVLRTPLIRYLMKHDQIKFVIKRDSSMKCLKTVQLKFLDILNYLAPGFSYDSFVKAYGCNLQKGFFPYEYVDSLDKLDDNSLPPHSSFWSDLKNSNISSEEYYFCQQVWITHQMKTMSDFLRWYNNRDVVPFLEAVEKQFAVYQSNGIDMFKDAVSVPGLATKWLYQKSDRTKFSIPLINRKHLDLYHTIRKNIVGGPAIVFHRYHERQKTLIREHDFENPKLCQKIYGFDANALYLWSAMQTLPTGSMIRRQSKNNFKPELSDYYGRLSVEWMSFIAHIDSVFIEHKFNTGERKIGQHGIPVDGFCENSNTVYQFHGCLFHGCPHANCPIIKNQTINPINLQSFHILQQKTKLKDIYIRALGYNLVTIYECEWKLMKQSSFCKSFLKALSNHQMSENKSMTESEVIAAIITKSFYGFVECDLHVPHHLRDKFAEMPPIFKHYSLSRQHLSPTMLSHAEKFNLFKTPQRALIGSFSGKKILVLTTLLHWYLKHGLEITKVYQIVQYQPFKCFYTFGTSVCDLRRQGDLDQSKKIISETAKLSGNVVYGTTITNKERFTEVKYVSDPLKVSSMANSERYLSSEELANDVYEVSLAKSKITLDTPVVIGLTILQLAKLRMLEFYYDLMLYYFNRSDFQYVTMDTDSAYFATSANFEDIVIPSKRAEFFSQYDKWFVPPFCPEHKKDFVKTKLVRKEWHLRECCKKAFDFHKRTPGLFKEEFCGDGIIALNSKMYFCFGNFGNKISSKGVSKVHNSLQKEQYLETLKKRVTLAGINKGIIRKNNKMFTYSQRRNALNFFYAKRYVHDDGVTTSPLNV